MGYEFRRGAEEIQKSVDARESGGGGNWRPFIQNFFWKDGDSKFLLFLNPVEDIPKVLMQEVWTATGRKAHVISRTDPAIGEREDAIQKTWQYKPVERNVAIALELEAEVTEVRGRPRPTGFKVVTRSYNRKVFDDKGEDTGEAEEVTTPVVGMVVQAPSNFFRHVAHKDVKVAPITDCAVEVTRLGGGTDTEYSIEMYENLPVDLTNASEFLDGISYLSEEEIDALYEIDDDKQLVAELGSVLLDKRLNEMADEEYYQETLDQIDEPAKFAKENKKSSSSSGRRAQQGRNRQARPSQRRDSSDNGSGTSTPEADNHDATAPESEEKPARQRRQRATKASPVADRLKELRAEGEAAAV